MATLRLVRAAERAGARRFLFFSALGASHHSRTRFFRAKALAQDAVADSSLETTTFSPSIVYSPGDPWLTLLERFSYLPAIPVSGSGDALYQPIWAEDVADGVVAALRNGQTRITHATSSPGPTPVLRRHRAAGAAFVGAPSPSAARAASARSRIPSRLRRLVGPHVLATWDEAELMEEPMVAAWGPPTPRRSGCGPTRMAAVLGLTGPGPRPRRQCRRPRAHAHVRVDPARATAEDGPQGAIRLAHHHHARERSQEERASALMRKTSSKAATWASTLSLRARSTSGLLRPGASRRPLCSASRMNSRKRSIWAGGDQISTGSRRGPPPPPEWRSARPSDPQDHAVGHRHGRQGERRVSRERPAGPGLHARREPNPPGLIPPQRARARRSRRPRHQAVVRLLTSCRPCRPCRPASRRPPSRASRPRSPRW